MLEAQSDLAFSPPCVVPHLPPSSSSSLLLLEGSISWKRGEASEVDQLRQGLDDEGTDFVVLPARART